MVPHTCSNASGSMNCEECWRAVTAENEELSRQVQEKDARIARLLKELEQLPDYYKDLVPRLDKIIAAQRDECEAVRGKWREADDLKDKALLVMNAVHSLLSLVRHRHLPKGLDLERDIDKALAASERLLGPWWEKEMQQQAVERPVKKWHCAKCGKPMQFADGMCMTCFGGDPGD